MYNKMGNNQAEGDVLLWKIYFWKLREKQIDGKFQDMKQIDINSSLSDFHH